MKVCKKCDKEITKNEKGVTWITFRGKEELEKIHWHFNCFLEWRNESLENRAQKLFQESMKKSIPMMKDLMKGIYNGKEKEFAITGAVQ